MFGRVIDEFNSLYDVDLRSSSRKRSLAYYRHCFAYIGRIDYMMTFADIGHSFNRDHSTAIFSFNRYKEFKSINDPWLNRYMKDVMVVVQRVDIPFEEFRLTYSETIDFVSMEACRLIHKSNPSLATIDRIMAAIKTKTLENIEEVNIRLSL